MILRVELVALLICVKDPQTKSAVKLLEKPSWRMNCPFPETGADEKKPLFVTDPIEKLPVISPRSPTKLAGDPVVI